MNPTRPLSDLQRRLLRLAERNRRLDMGCPGDGPDLSHGEALAELFGLEPTRFPVRYPEGWGDLTGKPVVGWQCFHRAEMGQRYDNAISTLSRTVRRLEQRGYVRRQRYGFRLTPEGIAVTRALAIPEPQRLTTKETQPCHADQVP